MKYYDEITKGFYEEKADLRIELTDVLWEELLNKQSQGGVIQVFEGKVYCLFDSEKVENDEIVDISDSDEYKTKIAEKQKIIKKAELQKQIDELDFKSIRALREGGIKDASSEQTWADYYTSLIVNLRSEIAGL